MTRGTERAVLELGWRFETLVLWAVSIVEGLDGAGSLALG
jgi:hypothetical protein